MIFLYLGVVNVYNNGFTHVFTGTINTITHPYVLPVHDDNNESIIIQKTCSNFNKFSLKKNVHLLEMCNFLSAAIFKMITGNQQKELAKTMKKKRTAKSKSPSDIRAAFLVFRTLINIIVYKTDISSKLWQTEAIVIIISIIQSIVHTRLNCIKADFRQGGRFE